LSLVRFDTEMTNIDGNWAKAVNFESSN